MRRPSACAPPPSGSSLVDLLLLVITQVLQCNESQAIDYVAIRIGNLNDETLYSKQLLRVDEAMFCLDIHDHRAMEARHKEASDCLTEKDVFADDYTQAKFRARGAGASRPKAKEQKRVLPLALAQAEVKQWLPPSSSCWRGNTRGEWWCHVQPFQRRIVVRLSDFGTDERRAIIAMLPRAWSLYNQKEGLPRDQTPIMGPFDGEVFEY